MKYKVYVSVIEYGSATVEADSEKEAEEKIYNDEAEIFFYESEISDVTAEVIKQFTGMYDCDGKEIYEGDIIQNLNFPEVKFRVMWYHGCWTTDCNENENEPELLYNLLRNFDFKVVGNNNEKVF